VEQTGHVERLALHPGPEARGGQEIVERIASAKRSVAIQVPYLPEIDAVEAEMKQLFSNLLTNAIKFRKPDTRPIVKITSTNTNHGDKNIYRLPNDKEFVTISVIDNGIGFEEEYAGKIFQIFQRLHGKSEFPGSGIGLAICKKIVENHNGVIFTKSELGKGTSFTIILPVKQN
jgi:signal transduction histidine kinase